MLSRHTATSSTIALSDFTDATMRIYVLLRIIDLSFLDHCTFRYATVLSHTLLPDLVPFRYNATSCILF